MSGSLVVFSSDGFQNELYIGVIRDRDAKDMDRTAKKFGYIAVNIEIMVDQGLSDDVFQIY